MSIMPSPRHDTLIKLFNDRPSLVVEILRDLMDVNLPDTPLVRIEKTTFNTRPSDDIEADLVMTLGPPQNPAHGVIVEIQQDKSKDHQQLARYAASLWLMLKCDVTVLVICPEQGVADHYARPIDSGLTGYRFQARALGPDGIPVLTDPRQAAAQLELAAMSVMMHGRSRKVVETFTTALADTDNDHAPKYYEYAYSMAAPEIRRLMEEIMTSTDWPVYSPFAREHYGRGLEEGQIKGKAQGRAEGKAEGKAEGRIEGKAEEGAKSILLVLTARGFHVPEDARVRITSCTDLAQLETWLTRAATARTLDDLFT
ncbi:RpnC/YadD family protein [Nonomuraea phyllanthi]|uniref:hypothetical protein n=1 Tax=Nonomuraea phyllanthi TaxID=2219224 RepID=UPI001D140EE6|nr:hypothetical protein [Nonomuraea phyllanthi]